MNTGPFCFNRALWPPRGREGPVFTFLLFTFGGLTGIKSGYFAGK